MNEKTKAWLNKHPQLNGIVNLFVFIEEDSKAQFNIKKVSGEAGVRQYLSKMDEAEKSNYAQFNGNKAQAAKEIGISIVEMSKQNKIIR